MRNYAWINNTMNALFSRHCVTIKVTFIQYEANFLLLCQYNISTRLMKIKNILQYFRSGVSLCVNVSIFYYFSEISSNTSLPKSHFSQCIESTLTEDSIFTDVKNLPYVSLIITIISGKISFNEVFCFQKVEHRRQINQRRICFQEHSRINSKVNLIAGGRI